MTESLLLRHTKGAAELPGFVLERASRRMKQYFQEQLQQAGCGITIDQWVILQELEKQDGLSQLEIAKATFKDAPTVTRILDLLCDRGLTRRITDLEDRRRFQIELTDAGRAKIAEALPVIEQAREKTWQGFDEEKLDTLMQMLNEVFENLK
ncbi:MAG TPA: MarR family transcriptional regulator [Saprospiraceae bacterium]|mgnify:CR=1 FL=1|nr:MarR family transcriptional regulator [Saprospiraceae bacterium]HMP22641.1 MarR family transcriptional regulator [Saprospiraceae bacterium]